MQRCSETRPAGELPSDLERGSSQQNNDRLLHNEPDASEDDFEETPQASLQREAEVPYRHSVPVAISHWHQFEKPRQRTVLRSMQHKCMPKWAAYANVLRVPFPEDVCEHSPEAKTQPQEEDHRFLSKDPKQIAAAWNPDPIPLHFAPEA
jgi:hypothetical protein